MWGRVRQLDATVTPPSSANSNFLSASVFAMSAHAHEIAVPPACAADIPINCIAQIANHMEWRDRVRLSLTCKALRAELHVQQNWRSVAVCCPTVLPSKDLAEALRSAGEHGASIRTLCVRDVVCTPYVHTGRTALWRLLKRMHSYFPVNSKLEELRIETANPPTGNAHFCSSEAATHDVMGLAFMRRFSSFQRMHFTGAEFPLCQVAAHHLTRLGHNVTVDRVRLMERSAAEFMAVLTPREVVVNLSRPRELAAIMRGVCDCNDSLHYLVVCDLCSALLKPEHLLALTQCISSSSLRHLEFRNCHLIDTHLQAMCRALPGTLSTLIVINNANKRRRGLTLLTHCVGRATVNNATWSIHEALTFAHPHPPSIRGARALSTSCLTSYGTVGTRV
jgi:hypothetical protein